MSEFKHISVFYFLLIKNFTLNNGGFWCKKLHSFVLELNFENRKYGTKKNVISEYEQFLLKDSLHDAFCVEF